MMEVFAVMRLNVNVMLSNITFLMIFGFFCSVAVNTMDKLQFLIFRLYFAVLLPSLCNVLLCNYSLSVLNIAAARHIKQSKIKTLTLRQVLGTIIHHRAKFHQNRSNGCRDTAI